MSNPPRTLAILLSLGLAACGGSESSDAGSTGDAGGGGTVDAGGGMVDGGGGMTDGGGGMVDGGGGMTDGGGADAGPVDAGPGDAGPPFGGVTASASTAAAGSTFSAAIDDTTSFLHLWGGNGSGELGTDTPSQAPPFSGEALAPITNETLAATTIVAVAAGDEHILALDGSGNVWAWGSNDDGEIGNDDAFTDATVPVMLAAPTGVTAIGAGPAASYAIDGDGDLWSWGDNAASILGDGTSTDRAAPVEVPAPSGRRFAAVGGGAFHGVGLMDDGTVWVWGNDRTVLGLGGTTGVPEPTQLTALSRVVQIAVGGGHTLALTDDGALWAWGANGSGQLGDGTTTDVDAPIPIDTSGLGGPIATIRATGDTSFAILDDGSLVGWGEGTDGQLGGADDSSEPIAVSVPVGVVDVAPGRRHVVAIGDDGRFYAWGLNSDGQLGDGTGSSRPDARPTRGPSGAVPARVFASSADWTFVLMDDGELWRVGRGRRGAGGGGSDTASAVYMTWAEPHDVEMIASAESHSLLLDTSGGVWSVGDNSNGQLGTGDTTPSDTLQAVTFTGLPAGERIVWVGASNELSGALDSRGMLWMWGDNRLGQVGDGTAVDQPSPVEVFAGAAQVSLGHSHVLVLDSSGFAWTFGAASSGRGGATPTTRCASNPCNPAPVRVCDVGTDAGTCSASMEWLGVVDEVAAGSTGSLIRQGDRVLAFGRNQFGQVGDGSWQGSGGVDIPQYVEEEASGGALTGITRIWTRGASRYALADDGTLYAWGSNSHSQLGEPRAAPPLTCTVSTPCRRRAAPIAALAGVTVSELAVANVFAVLRDATTGTVWSWGNNDHGQLGHFTHDSGMGGSNISWLPHAMRFLPR